MLGGGGEVATARGHREKADPKACGIDIPDDCDHVELTANLVRPAGEQ